MAGAIARRTPAEVEPEPVLTGRIVVPDADACERIAEMLRDPEWGVGMLEDIADIIRETGRSVEDYPDGRSTWGRH